MLKRKKRLIECQEKNMNNQTYIEIAVALPVYNTFTYSVSERLLPLVSVGKRALVPFGKRRVTGYIIGTCENNINDKETKLILDILDEKPLFPSSMIPFFMWIADYYKHPLGNVIKNALPGGLNTYDFATLFITKEGEKALLNGSVTPLEKEILIQLKKGSCKQKDLRINFVDNISYSLLNRMENNGLVVKKWELRGGRTKAKTDRYVSLQLSGQQAENSLDIPIKKLSLQKKKIIDFLKAEGEISVKKLKNIVPSASGLIKSMEKAGLVSIIDKKVYRDPFGESVRPDKALLLTKEQQKAFSTLVNYLGKGFKACLLAGVTGSGKTEVYMQLVAEAIKSGYSALVLVPEIALILQMERRFRARFGECVAILHSGLSAGERYDQWRRIADNQASIVIGVRSAIFAPFEDIGLIIIDEEHDSSYKQEGNFCYNARDMSIVRAKMHNSVVLLGSATPSIQSSYNAITKKFVQVTLNNRIEKRPLPDVTIVDLRKNKDTRGTGRFITRELHEAMKKTLERGEQIILFLNRRGFANFPVCASCGAAIQCKNCDISLTLHKQTNAYKCHYCGFTRSSVSNCLICGSSSIIHFGLGTEKVESAVKTLFPDATVARMDRDTTKRKGSILKILKGLRDKSIDILVGTQLVAKGHDFPNITLVGIICADLSLNLPDFRAGEKTFQLLAQVSGRAGRGAVAGKVILQTYNPNHFTILAAKVQDFKKFYNQEIGFRKALEYPPFSRIIQIKISGKDKKKTKQHAIITGNICYALSSGDKSFSSSIKVLGPIEAPILRIAKHFRWQILLKGLSAKPLHRFVNRLIFENNLIFNNKKVKVTLDVDPFSMM